MYETFDHTADLGLRIRAADLPTLFAEAGRALTSLLVEDVNAVREEQTAEFALPRDDVEYLFFDWLKAVLSRFEEARLLLSRFDVTIDDAGLRAVCRGETMDDKRHEPAHEVKAITYHGLLVEQQPDGW